MVDKEGSRRRTAERAATVAADSRTRDCLLLCFARCDGVAAARFHQGEEFARWSLSEELELDDDELDELDELLPLLVRAMVSFFTALGEIRHSFSLQILYNAKRRPRLHALTIKRS